MNTKLKIKYYLSLEFLNLLKILFGLTLAIGFIVTLIASPITGIVLTSLLLGILYYIFNKNNSYLQFIFEEGEIYITDQNKKFLGFEKERIEDIAYFYSKNEIPQNVELTIDKDHSKPKIFSRSLDIQILTENKFELRLSRKIHDSDFPADWKKKQVLDSDNVLKLFTQTNLGKLIDEIDKLKANKSGDFRSRYELTEHSRRYLTICEYNEGILTQKLNRKLTQDEVNSIRNACSFSMLESYERTIMNVENKEDAIRVINDLKNNNKRLVDRLEIFKSQIKNGNKIINKEFEHTLLKKGNCLDLMILLDDISNSKSDEKEIMLVKDLFMKIDKR